jgi:thiol:disulfide interchange protein DsbD
MSASRIRFLLFPFLLCLAVPMRLTAQFLSAPPKAEADLVADTSGVAAGKTFTVGIRFKIADKWHLYWRFPGDSGAAPSVVWDLPPGVEAGGIQWPLPESLRSEGDIFTNVYEHELLLPVEFRVSPQWNQPALEIKAALKWYVCSETCLPGEDTVSLTLPAVAEPQPANGDLFARWRSRLPQTAQPAPFQALWQRSPEAVTVALKGLPDGAQAELFPIPPDAVSAEHPVRTVDGTGAVSFRIASKDQPGRAAPWAALVVLQGGDGVRKGWEIGEPRGGAAASKPAEGEGPAFQSGGRSGEPAKGSLGAFLWTAFLGGLIMNLMPCVLPVIALKLFNFTRQAGEDPRKVFRLGLSFCAGVMVFFLGLAGAVIVLQRAGGSLNWGFQFQNPWLLLGLLSAVFVFGMNLLGVFEITLSADANQTLSALAAKAGHGGAFLHGVFTTLLGTSCTAPYLGVTLGFAASQPAPQVVAIFLTIGAGMSLPYLILTANPALLRLLPKPGVWMERLKQGMGFVILGVAVWLLGIVGETRGTEVQSGASVLLLALGMGCWMLGAFRSRGLALLLGSGLAAAAVWTFVYPSLKEAAARKSVSEKAAALPAGSEDVWETFSPERLAAEIQKGKPVFVDFTASWCLNCKVNEKVTLSRADVLEAFRAKGVTLLKADWSDGDPVITAELRKHERVGVPLYVLYTPGQSPVRFPEILKPQTLLDALDKLPKP